MIWFSFSGYLGCLRAKGRIANEHLKADHPEGPPVTGLVVAGLLKHLGGDVVRGAHCGVGKSPEDQDEGEDEKKERKKNLLLLLQVSALLRLSTLEKVKSSAVTCSSPR